MQKGIIKNVNKLTGEPIDAKDLASMLSGIIGNESGVLTVFDELRLEKISDNKVRLHSGVYSLKGHILYIPKGSYEDFEIESGTLGANRIDLLVAEYVKNGEGDGEDLLHFKVVKGEVSAGQPQRPDLIEQDINANGITRQEPLHEIQNTSNEIKINILAPKIKDLSKQEKETKDKLKAVENELSGIADRLGNLLIYSGSVASNTGTYPKPIHPYQIPRSCMIKVFWINNDGNDKNQGIGEAFFSVEKDEVSYITQETNGSLPVRMSVTPDRRNIQFNQATGYWARIHYIILINKM